MSGKKTKKIAKFIANKIKNGHEWRRYLEEKLKNLKPTSGYYRTIKLYLDSKETEKICIDYRNDKIELENRLGGIVNE